MSRYRKTEVTAEGRIIVDPQRILDSPEAQRHLASLRRANPMTTAADRERAMPTIEQIAASICMEWDSPAVPNTPIALKGVIERNLRPYALAIRADAFAKTKAACERKLNEMVEHWSALHAQYKADPDRDYAAQLARDEIDAWTGARDRIAALTMDDISEDR